ncbi:uncharacterized protein RHIMIDRAFT_269409 [Rhizopus microsporus ATCC 52813]|uniref:Uncharacterized protein n=1 Tax=Rhizopus microsporus ATCC 52813 TaxID=1340429 RepID=A0A2G4SHL3_RHIZD|nr:uncharacterized protein RHIMIDRAFT_269409 [Rhizopus microsporus ATCC 52813]PHZ08260.1 hypothetical protein RHIMIDRAFT_269409 [Rhizopus microsporus ATCC 52813]
MRQQAISIFFCLENTPENDAAWEKKIADFGEYHVYYENDPKRPLFYILLLNSMVRSFYL